MRSEATVLFLVLPYTSCGQLLAVGSRKSFGIKENIFYSRGTGFSGRHRPITASYTYRARVRSQAVQVGGH